MNKRPYHPSKLIPLANPIPEAYSMDHQVIDAAIEKALQEANEKGVKGQDVTPFLLAKIKDITGGDSLVSNIELVYNNARLAAHNAKHLVEKSTTDV